MDQGQEKFFEYIIERVDERRAPEAKNLLLDVFKKQSENNFTREDVMEFIPKIIALLKPDRVEEVNAVMKQFAQNFK